MVHGLGQLPTRVTAIAISEGFRIRQNLALEKYAISIQPQRVVAFGVDSDEADALTVLHDVLHVGRRKAGLAVWLSHSNRSIRQDAIDATKQLGQP